MIFEQDYLNCLFEYKDNNLLWKTHPTKPHLNGKIAGYTRNDGYVFVKILGVSTAVHKIVYCMYNGEWVEYPAYEIDHKDRNTSNNDPDNLRKLTKAENQDNSGCRGNSTGVKGVFFDKHHNKFKVCISVKGKLIHLGYYLDLDDACTIRQAAEINKNEGNFDSWYIRERQKLLGRATMGCATRLLYKSDQP